MRILWHSNSPFMKTGYGQQTAIWAPRLASLGHDVVISGYAGAQHINLIYDGIPVMAAGTQNAMGMDVIGHYYEKHKADRIIAETNNGGDLVLHVLQQVKPGLSVKKITASRGKRVRAEPISSLYEQGKVHHIGYFEQLETEMCEWVPDSDKSPDRMDALVWALTELSEGSNAMTSLAALAVFCPSCRMPAPKSTKICPRCGTPIGE